LASNPTKTKSIIFGVVTPTIIGTSATAFLSVVPGSRVDLLADFFYDIVYASISAYDPSDPAPGSETLTLNNLWLGVLLQGQGQANVNGFLAIPILSATTFEIPLDGATSGPAGMNVGAPGSVLSKSEKNPLLTLRSDINVFGSNIIPNGFTVAAWGNIANSNSSPELPSINVQLHYMRGPRDVR
jgi:hypothetical protein